MKTLNVAEAVQNFGAVLVSLENEQEEILLVRNNHPVARLVPEPESWDAHAMLEDLHGTLDDATAMDLTRAIEASRNRPNMTLSQLRNPWDS